MKVGDYVRTKDGYISKIKELGINIYTDVGCWSEDYVIKSSPNIIDLIEVGDYVNGKYIDDIDIHRKRLYSYEKDDYYIFDERYIKSIVTKEQFKSIKYKVGD